MMRFPYFLVFLTFFVSKCFGISVEEDLRLSYKQKLILDEFKERVSSFLPNDYMKEDIYLIRFLRANNFDMKATERGLRENLKWRAYNKMDEILSEDWSDFEEQYPYYLEGCDLSGRPVVSAIVGDWDVRKAIVTGKRDRIIRYYYKQWEEIATLIRQGQALGKNVTQYTSIIDMAEFSIVENACPACIPIYTNMLITFERQFPGLTHKLIIVNAPQISQSIFSFMGPLMSSQMREGVHVFGPNKNSWQEWLSKEIHRSQLTKRFGGDKLSAATPEELRNSGSYPC